jgi:hypothetical protein
MEENISNILGCNWHTQPSYQTLAWPNLVLPMIALTYQHGLWEHAVMLPQST